MKKKIFEKLKDEIEGTNYTENKKVKKNILFGGALIGNLLSLIFAFCYLIKIIDNSLPDFMGKLPVISIILVAILGIIEASKHVIFREVSLNLLSKIKFSLYNFMSAMGFGIIVLGFSIYLTISGAKEIVDRVKDYEQTTEVTIKSETDSTLQIYTQQINEYRDKINYTTELAKKQERGFYWTERQDMAKWEKRIEELQAIKDKKEEIIKNKNEQKLSKNTKENESNKFAFVLLSILFEGLIIVGVVYKALYHFNSYKLHKKNMLEDPNIKKYEFYEQFVDLVSNSGTAKIGIVLPPTAKLKVMMENKGFLTTNKEFAAHIDLLSHLKIIQTESNRRKLMMEYDAAIELLKKYFKQD